MARWKTADIPDLVGATSVVTGGTSGLGLHTALELVRHGGRVILASRDTSKGTTAVQQIGSQVPGATVDWIPLDLADLASIARFADAFRSKYAGLDLLVNNAGVMTGPRQLTVDGFELHLGVNHLGHFALTWWMMPSLLTRPGARVVTVTSGAHRMAKVNFDDLQGERSYRPIRAYAQSKLANLLFTLELQRRAASAGLDLRSVGVQPGFTATDIGSSAGLLTRLMLRVGQSPILGAEPTLYAATAPRVEGGELVGLSGRGQQRGYPVPVAAARQAYDEADARQLWERSEHLTGVHADV